MKLKITVRKNKDKKHDVRISRGGDILVVSKQGYENRADAVSMLTNLVVSIKTNNYTFPKLKA